VKKENIGVAAEGWGVGGWF